jgi:transcriptional regulator with XRE-family HTH domain
MTPDQQLDLLSHADRDEVVRRYLADRVRRTRRLAKLSQVELAKQAEVPLRTYKRFESHGKASLNTFVRVMMALRRTRYFFMLFPQEPIAKRPPRS